MLNERFSSGTGGVECEIYEGNYAPQVVLFLAQLISGIGQPLFYTLGTAYMDDNIKKSKTATFISKFNCLRKKSIVRNASGS